MTTVGVTGHQVLPTAAETLLRARLSALLAEASPPLIGVTSLAAGADQLFADYVLKAGGRLHVIIPSSHYEESFTEQADQQSFSSLLSKAAEVELMPHSQPSEEAFFAAGKRVVDTCDWLIAVWDGERARGLGGTADVVDYAQKLRKRVEVVWPTGVKR